MTDRIVQKLGENSMSNLPEKIKVTVSREDGSPLFDYEQTAQVQYLTEAAPVLIVQRDGRTLRTRQGSLQDALDFIEDLTLPY